MSKEEATRRYFAIRALLMNSDTEKMALMRQLGASYEQIGAAFGLHQATVSKWIAKRRTAAMEYDIFHEGYLRFGGQVLDEP